MIFFPCRALIFFSIAGKCHRSWRLPRKTLSRFVFSCSWKISLKTQSFSGNVQSRTGNKIWISQNNNCMIIDLSFHYCRRLLHEGRFWLFCCFTQSKGGYFHHPRVPVGVNALVIQVPRIYRRLSQVSLLLLYHCQANPSQVFLLLSSYRVGEMCNNDNAQSFYAWSNREWGPVYKQWHFPENCQTYVAVGGGHCSTGMG